MPDHEAFYYRKQRQLPDIGDAGQQKLAQARVLVVGAGGLGCPMLQSLAAAGIGTLGICDHDTVAIDNLHRQVLYRFSDQNTPKLDRAIEQLVELNPFIRLVPHREKLSSENAEELFLHYDLVLDCTDNFATRFLINDAAVLTKKPLIQASVYQFEGEIHGYHPQHQTACLRCLWPEIPEPSCIGNCAESGTLGAVTAVIGNLQAIEAIHYILGKPGLLMTGEWLSITLGDHSIQKLRRTPNPACPVCGQTPSITAIRAENYRPSTTACELSPRNLSTLESYHLIDIRTAFERKLAPLPEATSLELYRTGSGYTFPAGKTGVLVCQGGQRSLSLAMQLRGEGHGHIYSLTGGLNALKEFSCTSSTPA